MTSMTQDFEKLKIFFWTFSYYCLLLKSYHIVLKLTAPFGITKTLNGSKKNILEKNLWFQLASTFSSRTSLLNFWFLPDFVVVFIVIVLVLMFY